MRHVSKPYPLSVLLVNRLCPDLKTDHKHYSYYNSIAHTTTEAFIQIEYRMTNVANCQHKKADFYFLMHISVFDVYIMQHCQLRWEVDTHQ